MGAYGTQWTIYIARDGWGGKRGEPTDTGIWLLGAGRAGEIRSCAPDRVEHRTIVEPGWAAATGREVPGIRESARELTAAPPRQPGAAPVMR